MNKRMNSNPPSMYGRSSACPGLKKEKQKGAVRSTALFMLRVSARGGQIGNW